MEIWRAVWDLISIIVYVTLGIFFLIFLLLLIARIVKFNKLKFKKNIVVKSELVKKKMFKTSDGYELRWYGEINPKSEFVIIGIHDIYRNRKDFDNFDSWLKKTKNDKFSLVSFDQRNCGENIVEKQYHFGTTISDLKEIVEVINKNNPNSKIILLGDGFGSTLASFLSEDEKIYKIIHSSLRLNSAHKKTFGFYIKLWWGTLFKVDLKLVNLINGLDFTDDKKYAKKLEDENLTKNLFTVKDYYLWKRSNKINIKNFNKSKMENLVLLSNNDFYCNSKKIVKFLSKIAKNKYKLETIKGKKHYLLNTKDSDQIFKIIIENI